MQNRNQKSVVCCTGEQYWSHSLMMSLIVCLLSHSHKTSLDLKLPLYTVDAHSCQCESWRFVSHVNWIFCSRFFFGSDVWLRISIVTLTFAFSNSEMMSDTCWCSDIWSYLIINHVSYQAETVDVHGRQFFCKLKKNFNRVRAHLKPVRCFMKHFTVDFFHWGLLIADNDDVLDLYGLIFAKTERCFISSWRKVSSTECSCVFYCWVSLVICLLWLLCIVICILFL